jgi:hypothetical protein
VAEQVVVLDGIGFAVDVPVHIQMAWVGAEQVIRH